MITINVEVMNGVFDYDELDDEFEIVIKPDFLHTNDGVKYFQAFSCSELIPVEDNDGLCTLRRHFMDAIDWASFSNGVDGIVIDAFTGMFICESDMYDTVKQMNSLIDEDKVLN